MEENNVLHPTKVAKIIRNARFYNFSVDISESMRYINEQYRETYKSKYGGINWLLRRQEKRKRAALNEEGLKAQATSSEDSGGGTSGGGSSGGY